MAVKISFDKTAVERWSYRLKDAHQTVKNLFAVHDLPCVSEDNVLAFEDKGYGDDFAVMWEIILALLRADCLTGRGWGGGCVLSQVRKMRGSM